MVILMALSLIPSFIMLGGFKFVVYLAIKDETESVSDNLDRNLTILGMCGAIFLFLGRQFFSWLTGVNLCKAENLLKFSLVVQYCVLMLTYIFHDRSDLSWVLACSVYLTTSFVYGSIISLMPLLCS